MKRAGWKRAAKAPTSFSLTARICTGGKRHRSRHFLQPGTGVHRGTRLLLEESIADEFLALLKRRRKTGSRAIHLIPQPPWAPNRLRPRRLGP